jgi:Spy/CpxP family protein refolding chaperone
MLLIIAVALAISLPASAQAPPASASPQSTAPQSQTPPAHEPNQGAAQSAPSQANEDNPLNLTEDQKAKLRPIIMDENQQMEALRNDTTMTQEQKIAKANQIRAEASPKIKAILTPEQLQKLAELQQERARQQQEEQSPQQQQGQQGSPSSSPSPGSSQSPSSSQPPSSTQSPSTSQPPPK